MDVSSSRLGEGFWNTELVEKLGKLGSPIEVLPHLAESGVLNYLRVVEWFIDKTPAKTVARVLLELNDKDVPEVALVLDHLGPKGWTWLTAIDGQTFAQILEQVSPPLGIALDHASPELITTAQLVAWTQSRPGADVRTTLSDEERVDQIRELVPKLGPFELFSAIAQPTVLRPVLKQNPGIVHWLLESDATRVLPALTAPAVIDAAARALTAFDDNEALDEWLPSAAALGGIGKTIYVQLHARAKGGLRDALDTKLKAKLGRKSEDEDDQSDADENALTLREPGLFTKRLDVLFTTDAPRSTLLTLCRSEPAAWKEVAASPKTLATLKPRPSTILRQPSRRISEQRPPRSDQRA
jgi:hypothetical protein